MGLGQAIITGALGRTPRPALASLHPTDGASGGPCPAILPEGFCRYCLVRSIDDTLRTKKGPDQGHFAVKLYQVFLDALAE